MGDIYNLLNNAANEKVEENLEFLQRNMPNKNNKKDRIFMIWLRSKHMKLFPLHKII